MYFLLRKKKKERSFLNPSPCLIVRVPLLLSPQFPVSEPAALLEPGIEFPRTVINHGHSGELQFLEIVEGETTAEQEKEPRKNRVPAPAILCTYRELAVAFEIPSNLHTGQPVASVSQFIPGCTRCDFCAARSGTVLRVCSRARETRSIRFAVNSSMNRRSASSGVNAIQPA